MNIAIPVITMAALGFIFSAGLSFAYKKLQVKEDPKIEKVSELLPQTNCGACGFSGCRAFASALVNRKAEVNGCPVGGEETANNIASFFGLKAGKIIKKTARVHCRGTILAAKNRGEYRGISTCAASHLVGGNKQCSYGCMGFGDCVKACLFDAMIMGEEGLPIIFEDKCTACGKCVDACPRGIIELQPLSQKVIVFCRSLDSGKMARKVCKNACIACGICARACPEGIVMEGFIARISDPSKINPEIIPAIEKCPTQSIGRILKEENER